MGIYKEMADNYLAMEIQGFIRYIVRNILKQNSKEKRAS
jgi:hypothetical protein